MTDVGSKIRWRDPAVLLREMNVDEKIGQLWMAHGWHAVGKRDGSVVLTDWFEALLRQIFPGTLSSLMRSDAWTGKTLSSGLNRREAAQAVNRVQHAAINRTRLGIPLLITEECPHGLMAIGATTFPVGLGQAASWNPDLVRALAAAGAGEMQSAGGHIVFGPVLDLGRDPRWGRSEENFGEDVCLSSRLGVAAVQGFQSSGKIRCTLKHFAAYGVPEGGVNAGSSRVGLRELYNTHIPPFAAAVRAGAGTVMTSYNDIDGVPATANPLLFNGILRGECGFAGFVLSDSSAVPDLKDLHRIAATYEQASALALKAGVDVDLCPDHRCGYRSALAGALEKGLISMEDLDASVLRVLEMKFELGLFRNPYADEEAVELQNRNADSAALARRAAAASIVLLKNDAGILPLPTAVRKIALVGPNADDVYNMLGDYTAPQYPGKAVTVRDALELEPQIELVYAAGCCVKDPSRAGFEEALEAARGADVVVAVMGGSSKREYGAEFADAGQAVVSDKTKLQDMDCGESVDRASLDLMGVQNELLGELKKTGKPLVTILIHGRAMSVAVAVERSDALLTCFYPGEQGGSALCDMLFGRNAPAGRLPVTFPRSSGQLPSHYAKAKSGPVCYADLESGPLFPFGYGLSYTQFLFEMLTVSPQCISLDDLRNGARIHVSVSVRNTGSRPGVETVQLYLHDEAASIVRPFRELKAFGQISLNPGECGQVELKLGQDELKYWNETWRIDPGRFRIFAAQNAADEGLSACFEVTEL
jgi:beta-glucosidase